MTNIELPIWLLALIVGTPTLCLLAVVLRAAKRARQKRRSESGRLLVPSQMISTLDHSFQYDLHALQIDAVFNALSALIETERLKLKSLLCPTQTPMPEFKCHEQPIEEPNASQPDRHEMDVSQQIMERTDKGESAGEIADDLNISQSEVALAISMNQEVGVDQNYRLEAVA